MAADRVFVLELWQDWKVSPGSIFLIFTFGWKILENSGKIKNMGHKMINLAPDFVLKWLVKELN